MFQQELQIINFEGEAIYYGPIFSLEQSSLFFDDLLNNIEWKNEEIIMFGKEIISKRKVAFYADDGVDYTYSNKTHAIIFSFFHNKLCLLYVSEFGAQFYNC